RQFLEIDDFMLIVDDGAPVSAALQELVMMSEELAELLPTCAIAVGDEMVQRTHVLQPGDELSVLPPVNGG
ncbi:MAG: MoaD/ThiS family protein, partial [Acidimicrobiales bacterium]|nr:MoaD/ThiS family protein [Acidimicrobiales bacterium]